MFIYTHTYSVKIRIRCTSVSQARLYVQYFVILKAVLHQYFNFLCVCSEIDQELILFLVFVQWKMTRS